MGQQLSKDSFTPEDHNEFRQRLQNQINALKPIIESPGFSPGAASIGAEIEYYIVDENGSPASHNMRLLDMMGHPLLTEELNRFNLELNLSPVAAKGKPFSGMMNEVQQVMGELEHKAASIGSRLVSIGILPTLKEKHLKREFLTDLPRYRALSAELSSLKGAPFEVDISGQDSLKMTSNEVTLEGANTSFQVHLKVPGDRFVDMYNAAQLTTPLVMALTGNSPLFLGKRLWQETRIALFKQSIDNRHQALTQWHQPARVSYGSGWLRNSAWELFAENVALYRPLIPVVSPDNKPFFELNAHHGTVWVWNRGIFEPNNGGHLRIEFRSLPAGPTNIDMMANAALAIGLTQAFSHSVSDLLVKLPFQYAEYNFYRAAQNGLNANILWPEENQHRLRESHICDVIKTVLPMAAEGLRELEVDAAEIDMLMNIIEARFASRQTGAVWQLSCLNKYAVRNDWDTSLNYMLRDYMQHSQSGEPVSTWR